jgi:hypothetical protein
VEVFLPLARQARVAERQYLGELVLRQHGGKVTRLVRPVLPLNTTTPCLDHTSCRESRSLRIASQTCAKW